ncbi:MAG: hypothetical protein GX159_01580 [Flavobacteriaceae bacterium]|nr:hypothetical protein [Flavobacteriaceae bacterium]
MKSFLLCSFLLVFVSCASYTKDFEPKERTIERFTPDYLKVFEEKSFKISIDAFGNNFGGILAVKKLEINHYRLAFLNEFGGKILDFEIIERELKLNYAIEELDRKILLNLLEKDFAMLFSEENWIEAEYSNHENRVLQVSKFIDNKNLYYQFDPSGKLLKIILANGKEDIKIDLNDWEKSFLKIEISHSKMPIKIYLHLLNYQ